MLSSIFRFYPAVRHNTFEGHIEKADVIFIRICRERSEPWIALIQLTVTKSYIQN